MGVRIFKPYEDEKPLALPNEPGNRFEPEYKERYNDRGQPYLEKVGEVDTYEKIQSYKDECDVMAILSRYAAGDESVLAKPGWYIDTSKLPQTYTEYMNMMNEKKEQFNQLPLNIRQAFGMNFENWMATAGEKEWLNKMGIKIQQDEQKKPNPGTDETVQKGENKE
nr:MAG TPA: Scaffold protein [Microviridae sp.]